MFQPKITKARFVYSPFSATEMQRIGNALAASIKTRIQSGLNANDQSSKPLKGTHKDNEEPYAVQKSKKGLQPIRDWKYSGRTLNALKVLSANENKCVVGFSNPVQDKNAHFLNKIEKAFGVSPNDRVALNNIIKEVLKEFPIARVI